MTKQQLKAIQVKNPKYTEEQIQFLIRRMTGAINRKIRFNSTFNLTVPKLGKIHTHGNAKNKSGVKHNEKIKKRQQLQRDFSINVLLF